MPNKNLTNNQLLLKEIISQEYSENNQFASLDTFFELFSASQILKNYAFSDEELENGLIGGGNDGGCDAAYVLLNNEIITSDQIDSLAYIIHSGFISGYQNRYGDNLKPPTNVYHRMTA